MSEHDPNDLRSALEGVREAFEYMQGPIESGLADLEDDSEIQLRKACRLLGAARSLRENNGYYTAIVELSFVAIERSFEFFVLAHSTDSIRDFNDHQYAYQRAFDLGVISESLSTDYRSLYRTYRTESYYGDRQVTEQEATSMYALAAETHEYLRDRPSKRIECLCGD
jgi:hypothetical protein